MILEVYTVRDVVAGNYSELKMFNNEEQAKRWFKGLCEESKIGKDLQLYHCCDYDLQKGEFLYDVFDDGPTSFGFAFVDGGK